MEFEENKEKFEEKITRNLKEKHREFFTWEVFKNIAELKSVDVEGKQLDTQKKKELLRVRNSTKITYGSRQNFLE